MCVLIFSTTLSETFLILRRTERDIIRNDVGLHVQYEKKMEFSRQIFET